MAVDVTVLSIASKSDVMERATKKARNRQPAVGDVPRVTVGFSVDDASLAPTFSGVGHSAHVGYRLPQQRTS